MANKRKVSLKLGTIDDYQPDVLQYDFSYTQLRNEYSRLLKAARQRMRRLEQAGYKDSGIYRYYEGRLPNLRDIQNTGEGKRQLVHALSEAATLVSSEYGTPTGQRSLATRIAGTLQERGYDFVNAENLKKFGQFMEMARAQYGGKQFDSERAVKLFGQVERLKVPKGVLQDRFFDYLNNVEELEDVPKYKRSSGMTRTEYYNALQF